MDHILNRSTSVFTTLLFSLWYNLGAPPEAWPPRSTYVDSHPKTCSLLHPVLSQLLQPRDAPRRVSAADGCSPFQNLPSTHSHDFRKRSLLPLSKLGDASCIRCKRPFRMRFFICTAPEMCRNTPPHTPAPPRVPPNFPPNGWLSFQS